jgi:DNA repair protein RadC
MKPSQTAFSFDTEPLRAHTRTEANDDVHAEALMVCDAAGCYRAATADEVLGYARRLLDERVRPGTAMDSPDSAAEYLCLQLGALEHEVFAVLFLDTQLRLLAYEPMFRGTLSQTSVYPREVVKQALHWGAASVILAHNHPSGALEPSRADELLTQTLRSALQLVDVRVLDHFIVAGSKHLSFAQRGLL